MASIGYWAAHEQYSMHDLLKFVVEAEKRGFSTTMTSDHFHPWWHDNAYGNFTWVWIAAAAERTRKMQFVTGVTAPIYRYHPAIIAQAFSSLDVLYPGRIGLGLGTGEAMNEVPLGFDWPSAKVRLARTKEGIEIIKNLWGKSSTNRDHDGYVNYGSNYYRIHNAKIYTPPTTKIPIYLAASGNMSATIAAQLTDGLITFLKPPQAREILSRFDKVAKSSGKDLQLLQKIAEYKVSYAEDYEQAFESSKFWRATLIRNVFSSQIADPRKLEAKAKKEVSDQALKESIHIITSTEDCIKAIERYFEAGFTRVYVHSTSPNETKFITDFCEKAMPYFKEQEQTQDKHKVMNV
jgi:coenzyme F420-dependent glucose-6-phosphate dehydrogenase